MLVTLSAESLDASRLPVCLHAIIWKPHSIASHAPSHAEDTRIPHSYSRGATRQILLLALTALCCA